MLNLYCDPKDSAKGQQQQSASNDLIETEEPSAELFEEKLKLYSVVHKEPKEYCRPYKGKYRIQICRFVFWESFSASTSKVSPSRRRRKKSRSKDRFFISFIYCKLKVRRALKGKTRASVEGMGNNWPL